MATNQFSLHSGNDLELLAARLAELMRRPLADPFGPESIVVQNRGMAVYLEQFLAVGLGIAANIRTVFLKNQVEELLALALGRDTADQLAFFSPETMRFAIDRILRSESDEPAFEEYRRYLAAGHGDERSGQLAAALAALFDQYQIYRPEMILRGGPAEHSAQRQLWQRLAAGRVSRSECFQRFFKLRSAPAIEARFERISVFGISSMPPLYLWFFQKLAEFVPVHFFYQNPCRAEWSFAIAPRERRRPEEKMIAEPEDFLSDPDGFAAEFNTLLASCGKLGREFFAAILEHTDFDPDSPESLFRDPAATSSTLLARLQQHILDGENRDEPEPVAADDRSLTVANCHHPLREVEALHDELLRRFNSDPTLRAGDVIVMTPDIEVYAPYVKAVFESIDPGSLRYIPFSLGDRPPEREIALLRGCFTLFKTALGAFKASEILALLECDPLRENFKLGPDDLPKLRRLLADNHASWGLDAAHRAALLGGDCAFAENSWRFVRDRLLLGFAMRSSDTAPVQFDRILAADRIEGDRARLAEALELILAALERARARLLEPRTPEAWAEVFAELLDDFFGDDRDGGLRRFRDALAATVTSAGRGGFDLATGPELMLGELERRLEADFRRGSAGFLRGGVTFCTLLPMRNIPHRVIAILGLDEAAYPRRELKLHFDMIGKHPRGGDRSLRIEDRYLFLEALLAAREALYLSYVGQSVTDNSELPPSPLVADLLGYVRRHFRLDGRELVVRHPLQGFSVRCFTPESPTPSYSEENFRTARILAAPGRERPRPDFPAAVESEEDGAEPTVASLSRFFANPFEHYGRNILKMDSPFSRDDRVGDIETIEPNMLQRADLRRELFLAGLRGEAPEPIRERRRAAGELPPGALGDLYFEKIAAEAANELDLPRKELGASSCRELFGRAEIVTLPPRLRAREIALAGRADGRLLLYLARQSDERTALFAIIFNALVHHESAFAAGLTSLVLINTDQVTVRTLPESVGSARKLAVLEELRRRGDLAPLEFMPRTSRAIFEGKSFATTWHGNDYSEAEGEWENFFVRRFAPYDLENAAELDAFRAVAAAVYGEDGL